MKKGDIYKVKGKEKFYMLAGYWGSDLVLAPVGEEEDQVQVYGKEDMREFLDSGYLSKLHPVKMPAKA